MSELKDKDPAKYTRYFKEGVRRAEQGEHPDGFLDVALSSEDAVAAIHDGYRAAVASKGVKK